MTKALYEDMGLIKNPPFPLKDYCAFINFFQKQAQVHHDKVYFRYQTRSSDGSIVVKTLTFGQVDRITSNLACILYETLGERSTIALLENHTVHYPLIQLSILKLRVPALLLSARNSAEAIIGLLEQVGADALLYGEQHQQMKDQVMARIKDESNADILFAQVPEMDIDLLAQAPLNPKVNDILNQNFTEEDLSKIAVIIHSSGTTSTPKAIRWNNRFHLYLAQASHYDLVMTNMTDLIEDEKDTLIGITPSWHMFGIVSNIYPLVGGSSHFYFEQFPPSTKEIIETIKSENITRINAPPYYVNQLVHYIKETGDIKPFQKLKLISSGGAPIPKETDEFFAKNNLNLRMLYGMSECFNLMRSDFSKNKISSNIYFFFTESYKFAYFEHFEGDRYQLIVRAGAPFLASGISLRSNGDYATKDLFTKSALVKHGYVYVGRTDDTLVMVNGEKTNPLPMEHIIKSNPMVSHCTIIGESLPCTAALIELNFEAVKSHCLDVVLEKVLTTVSKANETAPNYSAILPQMVKIIPFNKRLPTTDKGTVSRKRAIQLFQKDVDDMYEKFLSNNKRRKTNKGTAFTENNGNSVRSTVIEAVSSVLGAQNDIREDESLFKQGLNSLLSIQLRNLLSEQLFDIPQDFFYEYSSIKDIIRFFQNKINTGVKDSSTNTSYDYQITTDILEDFLKRASVDIAKTKPRRRKNGDQDVVLLTGATGSLGSHILYKLLENPKVKKVYALVRPQGNNSLLERIVDGFTKRGYSTSNLHNSPKLEVLPMNLEQNNLGFSATKFNILRSEVTTILACAWLLDFKHTVAHYKLECLEGLYNLVKFANTTLAIDLHFVSSVSASSAYSESIVPEEPMPADPRVALPMGYAQSKFIVEQLFHYLTKEKNMPCFIHRVGQLCGDSTTGVWNSTEMYPLTILGGGVTMKKMPEMDTTINWLPIDYAGQAIIDIMLTVGTRGSAGRKIFHVVNAKEVSWPSMLAAMREAGLSFETIDPESWVKELSQNQSNPAYKLLTFYEKIFKNNASQSLKWETGNTESMTRAIVSAPTVNDRLSLYLQRWVEQGPVR